MSWHGPKGTEGPPGMAFLGNYYELPPMTNPEDAFITKEEVAEIAAGITPNAGLTVYVPAPQYVIKFNSTRLITNGKSSYRTVAAAKVSLKSDWRFQDTVENAIRTKRGIQRRNVYYRGRLKDYAKVVQAMFDNGIITVELE